MLLMNLMTRVVTLSRVDVNPTRESKVRRRVGWKPISSVPTDRSQVTARIHETGGERVVQWYYQSTVLVIQITECSCKD